MERSAPGGDEPEEDRTCIITRVFDLPAHHLFLAYSAPEHLKRWFGPPGYPLTLCEMDFREGGRFRFAMSGPDGKQTTPFGGTYLEIVEDRKIVYDNAFEEGGAEKMVVSVLFDEAGGRTTLTVKTVFGSIAMKDLHMGMGYEQGTGAGLAQLDEHLRTPGLGARLVARLLDFALVLAAMLGLGAWIGFGFDWLVLAAPLPLLYFAGLDAATGTTLGKRLLGIIVTGPDGGRPTPKQALLRESFVLLGAIPFLGPPLALGAWVWIILSIRSHPLGQGKARSARRWDARRPRPHEERGRRRARSPGDDDPGAGPGRRVVSLVDRGVGCPYGVSGGSARGFGPAASLRASSAASIASTVSLSSGTKGA